MAYMKHEFKSGDKLYASQLNEMDEQIFNLVHSVVQTTGDSESAVMSQNAVTDAINSAVSNIMPEFVDSIEEMTDTAKKYVLTTTGTVWKYDGTVTETENKITVTDELDDTTYYDGYRLSGSATSFTDGLSNDAAGYNVTPLIDLTKEKYVGKTIQIHLEGSQYITQGVATWIMHRSYHRSGSINYARGYSCIEGNDNSLSDSQVSIEIKSDTNAVITITNIPLTSGSGGTNDYYRFCGKGSAADSHVYITYEDTEIVTTIKGWTDTNVPFSGGGSSIELVQTTGDSETAVMSQKAVTEAISNSIPEFVDNVTEMSNESKRYVLNSTGTIWEFDANASNVEKEVTITEQVEGTTDNPYVDGNRFDNSTASDTFSNDATGYHLTPMIDLTKEEYQGKTIELHLEGAQYASTGTYAQWIQTRVYGTSKNTLVARSYTCDTAVQQAFLTYDTDGIAVTYNSDTDATLTIDVPPTCGSAKTTIGYLRFCGKGAVSDSNIYITYKTMQVVEGEGGFVDTGKTFIPTLTDADKQQMAEDVAAMIDTQLLDVIGNGVVV